MPSPAPSPTRDRTGRRLLVEWLLTLALVLAVAWSTAHVDGEMAVGNNRIDAVAHDWLRQLIAVEPASELVIVDIDDTSLSQLGRWPWNRAIHAALIDRLVKSGVRAIGMDLLLVESTPGDRWLADAVSRAQRAGIPVVLPVGTTSDASGAPSLPLYPVAEFARNAHLGHAHYRVDDDGTVRGLYLDEGAFAAFSLELMRQVHPDGLPRVAQAALRRTGPAQRDELLAQGRWVLDDYVLLPRLRTKVPHLSYAAVLRGEVPAASLRDRIVLIGASAAGLGDRYASGLVGDATLVSGVDLHGAALTALLHHRLVVPETPTAHFALSAGLLLAAMIVLYRVSPRSSLAVTLASGLLVLTIASVMLRAGHWWPPGGCLLGLAFAYPWWNWRRLEVATSGLLSHARALADTTFAPRPGSVDRLPAEPVARSVVLLGQAASRSVALRRFLLEILEQLPHPAFVVDDAGCLLFANLQVSQKFDRHPATGCQVRGWLADHAGIDLPAPLIANFERSDRQGRDWLLDSAQMNDPEWSTVTLLQLVDISPIRAAQREREQTLRFLSHDLRAPQVTILSIIEQRDRHGPVEAWAEDIRAEARRSLELANGFVELARAEAATLAPEPLDLVIVLDETRDACWRAAQAAGARLNTVVDTAGADEAIALGDAQLLRRALTNLVDNAIKYGRAGGVITLALQPEPAVWCLSVSDEGDGSGTGLDDDDLSHLFEPFWRSGRHRNKQGIGLGLSFVRVVAERHAGRIGARRLPGGGACFELRLPAQQATGADETRGAAMGRLP